MKMNLEQKKIVFQVILAGILLFIWTQRYLVPEVKVVDILSRLDMSSVTDQKTRLGTKRISKRESNNTWMAQMERKYMEERERISTICQSIRNGNARKGVVPKSYLVSLGNMMVDSTHKLAYCEQPKVGSTTWMHHFYKLFPRRVQETMPKRPIGHWYRNSIYTSFNVSVDFLKDLDYLIEAEKILAFTFVRHPFERLVSAYKQKVLGACNNENICGTNQTTAIIELTHGGKYKEWYNKNHTFPAFADLVLDEYRKDICYGSSLCPFSSVDIHWRPLSSKCSHCDVSYNVIGHMETFNDDIKFISTKANLSLEILKQENSSKDVQLIMNKKNESLIFFSRLNLTQISELYRMYETDFRLFNYDAKCYFGKC